MLESTPNGYTLTTDINVANIVLTGVSSILSILGSAIIFITFWRMPEIRNFTRWLLLYLTIADFLTATWNLVGMTRYVVVYGDDSIGQTTNVSNCTDRTTDKLFTLCVVQSFFTTSSNMSSFLWTFVIAVHVCVSVWTSKTTTESCVLHAAYHVVCWIAPVGISTALVSYNYLGEDYCFGTGVWCGIRSNIKRHKLAQLMYLADVGWQLVAYTLSAVFYMCLKYYIYRTSRKRESVPDQNMNISFHNISVNLRDEDRNYLYIPLGLYLLKCWGLLRFFLTTYLHKRQLEQPAMKTFLNVLLFLQSYGASAQATLNCVVFCFLDKTVRERLWLWTSRLCGCIAQSKEMEPLLTESKRHNKTSDNNVTSL